MRSWSNRPDTFVVDEPLYANYLVQTGVNHPGREEVIRHHEKDWRKVVDCLTGDIPGDKLIFYQKHMAHHLLPSLDRGWLERLTHCFLIRDPHEMLTSLIKHVPSPTLKDTGLPQQVEIVHFVQGKTGRVPPIVDARDVLESPRRMLEQLCGALGIDFLDAMLSWPQGRRKTDGIWAKHWYAAVEASTGFQPYRPKHESVPNELRLLLARCVDYYEELYTLRLKP